MAIAPVAQIECILGDKHALRAGRTSLKSGVASVWHIALLGEVLKGGIEDIKTVRGATAGTVTTLGNVDAAEVRALNIVVDGDAASIIKVQVLVGRLVLHLDGYIAGVGLAGSFKAPVQVLASDTVKGYLNIVDALHTCTQVEGLFTNQQVDCRCRSVQDKRNIILVAFHLGCLQSTCVDVGLLCCGAQC